MNNIEENKLDKENKEKITLPELPGNESMLKIPSKFTTLGSPTDD